MRAVLDPNVIISALLSPRGTPARILRAWLEGAFELIVSPLLLAELERALAYPKLRQRVTSAETARLLAILRREASNQIDPASNPVARSRDPGDDYLIALASSAGALLVSGDGHLLAMSAQLPVESPASFLARLQAGG